MAGGDPRLKRLFASAARLQELVPDAVLVGDSAAALHAGHRISFDHDHVVADLSDRYGEILSAVEASEGWATSVRASSAPMTILGSLDGVDAGLRQLRRSTPLEVEVVRVVSRELRVPTLPEMLRVTAYLVVQRNQVRDYLDTVALAEELGEAAVDLLLDIDAYYRDGSETDDSVLSALVQRLAEPHPRDARVTTQLSTYKGIVERWSIWAAVRTACAGLADALLDRLRDREIES